MIAATRVENPPLSRNPKSSPNLRRPTGKRSSATDWAEVIDRLGEGDPGAYRKLDQLVCGFLSRWDAFDMRDSWDDIVQDVASALLAAGSESITTRAAAIGYIRSTTRFKFIDRIQHRRHPLRNTIDIDDFRDCELDVAAGVEDWKRLDLGRAVSRLPDRQRAAVLAVHARGYGYAEAAEVTGIPLGSLKRHLRYGLEALRTSMVEGVSPT